MSSCMTKCCACLVLSAAIAAPAGVLPSDRWIEVKKDMSGARPGSALRFVPEANAFLLWGLHE